jgi:hypothetical protein
VAPSLPFWIASKISWVCGREYSLYAAARYIAIIKIFLTHSSRFFINCIYPNTAKLPKKKVGRQTGFEPATPGTTNQCSNQLSYYRHKELTKVRNRDESSTGKVCSQNSSILVDRADPLRHDTPFYFLLCFKLEL